MRYLFCITGYGASGKDTFLKELQSFINIKTFPTYSDRPARSDDENSSTYCISSEDFDKNIDIGFFIETRSYLTDTIPEKRGQRNIWRYATPNIVKSMEDNSVAAMVTSFDQFCNIYDAAPDELCAIPIVMNTSKSLILHRSLTRLFGTNDIDTIDLDKLNDCDRMVREVASRFLRDLDQQGDLENIPAVPFKFSNNNIDDLKNNVYNLGMSILKYNYLGAFGDINGVEFEALLKILKRFMDNGKED